MAKLLFIQIEGAAPILQFTVDEIDSNYEPPSPDPAQRQIAGMLDGRVIPESIHTVSELVGWWLVDTESRGASQFLRVQAPGNPTILKLGYGERSLGKSYAAGGGSLLTAAINDRAIAEFNVVNILGWWPDLPKKYLRIQAPGNPTVLRIEVSDVKVGNPPQVPTRDLLPLAGEIHALNGGEIVATFAVPQIIGWWVEDENPPEVNGLPGKHLFIVAPDNPAPAVSIDVDQIESTESDPNPRLREIVGIKNNEVVASFNIPSINRYWIDFAPEKAAAI